MFCLAKSEGIWPSLAFSLDPLAGTEQNRLFQLEGTSTDHLAQRPDPFRADQTLTPVKGTVPVPLGHGQAWGIGHLARKPVPRSGHLLSAEMLPRGQPKPLPAQLWTVKA